MMYHYMWQGKAGDVIRMQHVDIAFCNGANII
jgi:hypothetical protein